MTDLEQKREYLAEHLLGWTCCSAPLPSFQGHHGCTNWLGTYEGMGAVLEAMRERDYEFDMVSLPGMPTFACRFYENWVAMGEGRAESLPDAVCLAAGAALREGNDG